VSTPLSRVFAWDVTPVRLKLARTVATIVAAMLALVIALGWSRHKEAIQTVGGAAPQVISAHDIKTWIEQLDADTLDEMLDPPSEMGQFVSDFDRHRVEIGEHLITATRAITFGDNELVPIKRIEDGLGRYLMASRAARDAHVRLDKATELAAYRESYNILKDDLVPAANDLYTANSDVLDSTYRSQLYHGKLMRFLTIVVGTALVLLLLAIQLYLTKQFRRMINPPLVAATVLTVVVTLYVVLAFNSHRHHLREMKEDAYDSVEALVGIRADAFETNAAESRWLYDTDFREHHEKTFAEHAGKLVSLAPGQNVDRIYETLIKRNKLITARIAKGDNPITACERARAEVPLSGFDGALKKALDNVTFPSTIALKDEPTQSAETFKAWNVYVALDPKIRELETAGKHAEAVALEAGTKSGQSEWTFLQFDTALGNWLDINTERMAHFSEACFADIHRLPYVALAIPLLLITLVFVGLRPRLKEYA
jgi:hypothetical protein